MFSGIFFYNNLSVKPVTYIHSSTWRVRSQKRVVGATNV